MIPNEQASIPLGAIWAPRLLSTRGGRLLGDSAHREKRRPRRDLLERFCRIPENTNAGKAAVRFAKDCGLIGLCGHGLPTHHSPACVRDGSEETVEAYRKFALCLGALRRVGLELNAGRSGDVSDWELADGILSAEDFPVGGRSHWNITVKHLQSARTEFMTMMRRLTLVSQVQPRLHWDGQRWAIDFDSFAGSNIAALLTVQLMAQVGGTAMKKCRSCPRWFQSNGRQAYCNACGIKAAWREAARKQRQKRQLEQANENDR
jgi:hypothetical protein